MNGRRWTREEVETVLAMRKERRSRKDIAKAVHRSVQAVQSVCWLHGVTLFERVDWVKEMCRPHVYRDLAERTGRKVTTMMWMKHNLKRQGYPVVRSGGRNVKAG